MTDTDTCPNCGARTAIEPVFPNGKVGIEHREFRRGCQACGWIADQLETER